MRKITFLFSLVSLCLLLSCSSDEGTPLPVACFETSVETEAMLGEEITITSCSENASAVTFSYFLNGEEIKISDSQFTLRFAAPGAYRIDLEATNIEGATSSTSKTITVSSGESNFKFFDYPLGTNAYTLGSGFDEDTQTLYFIEETSDYLAAMANRKVIYREVDNDYTLKRSLFVGSTSRFYGHYFKTKNTNLNQCTFTAIHPELNTSITFTIEENGNFVSQDFSSIQNMYGAITVGNKRISYGANSEYVSENPRRIYPVIEVKDANDNLLNTYTFETELPNAFLGDLIKVNSGYLGYGGSFEHDNDNYINYTPVLFFFDDNYELKSYKVFENTALKSEPIDFALGTTWFHIEQLTSGNIVMYGFEELIVTNASGDVISITDFRKYNLIRNQGIVNLGNSFIISTNDYLRKFDASGNELKHIFFDGDETPNLFYIDNKVIFISSYATTDPVENLGSLSVYKIFMGAVDQNLNLINLNN